MKLPVLAAMAACSVALCGCASSSDEIGASYVSPFAYQNYTCPQLTEELERISARVHEVAGGVDSAATNDKVAMGVGLVIFWPALLLLKGNGPEQEELARLKGEYDAVNESMIRHNCASGMPPAAQPVASMASPPAPARVASMEPAPVVAPPPRPAPIPEPHASAAPHLTVADGTAAMARGDYPIALAAWKQPAEQGNPIALNGLGFMYERGYGVSKDSKLAMQLYEKAAAQGSYQAGINLGGIYESGEGVKSDPVLAYAWYSIAVAASSGDSSLAQTRLDGVAKGLSESDTARAKILADRCQKSNFAECGQ